MKMIFWEGCAFLQSFPQVGWGTPLPKLHPPRCLRRLDPRAYGAHPPPPAVCKYWMRHWITLQDFATEMLPCLTVNKPTFVICVATTIFGWLMTNSCNCWMPITRFFQSLDVKAASICCDSESFWSPTTRLDTFFVTVADDDGIGRRVDGSWPVSKLSHSRTHPCHRKIKKQHEGCPNW